MTTIALPTTVTALPCVNPPGAKDTAPSARVACGLRRRLWRLAVAVTGGMTVTGRWRVSGGCVVVANHSSHADTAVLLAALPRRRGRCSRRRPTIGSMCRCAGSWPARWPVSCRCRAAGRRVRRSCSPPPVRRCGRALRGDLSGGHPLDRWRNREFHSGAVRLARSGGADRSDRGRRHRRRVTKGGSYRRAPMAVHIGEPVDAGHVSPSQLRNRSWPYATVAGRGMPRCGGRREARTAQDHAAITAESPAVNSIDATIKYTP